MKGTTIIIVLAVVVVAAAALYYGVGQPQSPTPTNSGTGEDVALTPDEQAALNFPAAGASPAEIQRHFDAASKIAQTSESLNVTNCVLKPLVLQAEAGSDILVVNDGTSAVTLEMGSASYNVPARGIATIKADFEPGGGGLYGYGCNVADPSAGFDGSGTGLIMLIAE